MPVLSPSYRNLLRIDPSRTGLLRRAFYADLKRRFGKVQSAVWKLIVTDDAFGLKRPLTTNFDPDEARDEKGRWAEGGHAAEMFVSPNTEPIDFDTATSRLRSSQQANTQKALADVDKEMGLSASHVPVIGAWRDGAENSTLTHIRSVGKNELRVAGAMKGLLTNQKQVLVFHHDGSGDGFLAHFPAKGTLSDIHANLLKQGLEFHSIVPDGTDRAIIYAYGSSPEELALVKKVGGSYGQIVKVRTGTGEFIGTQKSDGTDAEQREDARRTYLQIIHRGGEAGVLGERGTERRDRDYSSIWRRLHARYKQTLTLNAWSDAARQASIEVRRKDLGTHAFISTTTPHGEAFLRYTPIEHSEDSELEPNEKAGIGITDLEVPVEDRGKGIASKLLNEIHKEADRRQVPVYLHPYSKGGMSHEALKVWYAKRGYKPLSRGRLLWVRQPNKPGPITNAPSFKFETDDNKLKKFNAWLKKQIDDGILEVAPVSGEPIGQSPWLSKYVNSAYKKGALATYIKVKPELLQKQPFYEGSKAQFLESAFGRPERVSKLKLLHTRAFENLKGVTSTMASQMNRQLADGLAHGKGPMEIARGMSKTIGGLTRTRARAIANTEIINAHAESALDSMEDLGIESTTAEVEFSTAGDDLVCEICQDLEGEIYTIAEARGVIPRHVSCRCSWSPVVKLPSLKRK
jgi:SPP1 gp7 family putative phage head morphogenesis protein